MRPVILLIFNFIHGVAWRIKYDLASLVHANVYLSCGITIDMISMRFWKWSLCSNWVRNDIYLQKKKAIFAIVTWTVPTSIFPFCFALLFSSAPITESAVQSRSLCLHIAMARINPSLVVINRCSMKKLFSSQYTIWRMDNKIIMRN
jgi:hypothetical protein